MSNKIQRPRRITSEGLEQEAIPVIDRVGESVNTFMEEVYSTLMGNTGVEQNLNMEFKTIDVEVDSSGIPKFQVAYRSDLLGRTMGMSVIRVFNAFPVSQPFCSFTDSSGLVTITNITGLQPNIKYQLVILAIGA
jgi:hypothetical protein